jgi:hypothetical protein
MSVRANAGSGLPLPFAGFDTLCHTIQLLFRWAGPISTTDVGKEDGDLVSANKGMHLVDRPLPHDINPCRNQLQRLALLDSPTRSTVSLRKKGFAS